MAFTYIFKRVEKKYMLTREQYEYLINAISPYMAPDQYGETEIRNIYFDNADNELIETSLLKPTYKEKLRLRSYGVPKMDSTVFFEIKKKYRGIVYKRRISMKLKEAYAYIDGGKLPESIEGNIPTEIDYMMNRYSLTPKAFISYKRVAWTCESDPDLRITFDRDITSRYDDTRLESTADGHKILPKDTVLMEIKIPGAMPLWLAHILSEKNIFPHSFSKFGTAHVQNQIKIASGF
ncbi:MAG: polyphosphate polymerase domain-containing protein [Ruminococcus sp.]|nr:polyphosphate polymerase domain-containing protein [Ruminococcus sp.]MBQ1615894.1 polyphosphate polymerase domain-containing protein [Ruminococcus sp.]MBQ1898917.1 polyphosphate polymerase domain-containing protein [Ruminococcus sp.]MBQ4237702.1 polyphosphate polymerase domain-containing protein [Ruminococcus sp.]